EDCAQARSIVAELKRRQERGAFAKVPPASVPPDVAADVAKKVAWLIDALDEVDARQLGQPGGVDLGSDWRVRELIALRDRAVPALIDTLEKDDRLTRSVHFWRDFSRDRTVLSVREAALVAVMSIVQVRAFEPNATGDNFTRRGGEAVKRTAARLRTYWSE